ncbi:MULTISPECIES: methyltransferase family protein [unclassified Tardiphaga]|uniref:methyltransferase family protein n=1 Tax=unclassified Tardiphaga TaxID=2631404 RepID=UPI001FEF3627|nr:MULTISPECIES: isoprenylcysteine carboxylmethyltransferase family protein [unclassified Tardiphaga]
MDDISKRPNAVPWPPLVLTVAATLSIALGYISPMSIPQNVAVRSVGYLSVVAGISLDVWAIITLNKAHTSVLPHRGASRLVTHGPFGFTRNPIYLGNTMLMGGIGLAFAAGWFAIMEIVSAFIVDRLAIRPEERHLAARFGKQWIDYASRVPRWLF